jgi:hypothetical protein
MLRRIVFGLVAFATAWFFAVATFASMVGPVYLCNAAFQPGFCAALGVQ